MYSKRIGQIVEATPVCDVVADIGCDHGYIGVSLLKQGKAKKVWFADISAPSLQKAKRLCEAERLSCMAEFAVCDGAELVPYADCLVIAGMGGKETIHILENCPFMPPTVVLQPMRNLPDVRKHVIKNYRIVSDRIMQDGKFYNILYLERGSDNLTADQILFGKTNLTEKSDDFKQYIALEITKTKLLLEKKADNADKAVYLDRLCAIAEELKL